MELLDRANQRNKKTIFMVVEVYGNKNYTLKKITEWHLLSVHSDLKEAYKEFKKLKQDFVPTNPDYHWLDLWNRQLSTKPNIK